MSTSLTNRHRRTGGPAPDPRHPTGRYQRWEGESPRFVIWMTAARTHREHCVTYTQAAQGRARHGVYESICDARFVPLPMTAPPGPRCRLCEVIHREWIAQTQPAPQKPHTLRRLTAGLFRRRRPTPSHCGG